MVLEARDAGLVPREAAVLTTFTPESAASLPGPDWLRRRRSAAAEAFGSLPLPSEKDEVWRYSRIDQLDLGRFRPRPAVSTDGDGQPPSEEVLALVEDLGPHSALTITVDGRLTTVVSEVDDRVLTLRRLATDEAPSPLLGSVLANPHEFQLLNDAFAAEPLVVDVAPGASIEEPVVIVHVVSGEEGDALFPRTVVRVGAGSTAEVVEILVGSGTALLGDRGHSPGVDGGRADGARADGGRADGGRADGGRADGGRADGGRTDEGQRGAHDHLVVPVTEAQVCDGATLSLVTVQSLGPAAWVLGHQASSIGTEATLRSFAVALGGSYARLRTDSALAGESGTSLLRAAFIGRAEQMLDFRTLQDHVAPRTTSDLLFMGAVADRAHSVYSGLIRVRPGAVRSDAMQTNHNLVLDEGAHADSVPNLDIQENDVRCSHASTVGPVDEDQRYYLESRGVEPEVAERLIVSGFFQNIADQVPVAGARPLVGTALATAARTGWPHG